MRSRTRFLRVALSIFAFLVVCAVCRWEWSVILQLMMFVFLVLGVSLVARSRRGVSVKSAEQEDAIKYFADKGCLAGLTRMKDNEYDQMVMTKLNALNLKQRALEKIGLDEDQLKEIPPVFLHGYNFDSGAYARVGSDNRLRSSKYDATWLFFSDTQVYMYSYTMDMTSDNKKEATEEYFYKDITNFSTSSESIEATRVSGCIGTKGPKIIREYNRFSLVVPGDKFYCSISGVADADRSISAMKQKLREKKQQ